MIPLGYLYKTIVPRPDWIKCANVEDICSVSGCISKNFSDYINYWKHNGYWLFNSPSEMEEIAAAEKIDLSEMTLVYYEGMDVEFDVNTNKWSHYSPEPEFITDVKTPNEKEIQGYDIVTFNGGNLPECSPLSCNGVASEIPVNRHCLFDSFDQAKSALDSGVFKNSEPGPHRILAVYKIPKIKTDE